MNSPRPPLLAIWVFRLIVGPHSEALEGDLLEGWRDGRSRAWYWRQVLVAVSPVRHICASSSIRLVVAVAALAITALAALLVPTMIVVVAGRERSWWSMLPMIVGLLACYLPLGLALRRRLNRS